MVRDNSQARLVSRAQALYDALSTTPGIADTELNRQASERYGKVINPYSLEDRALVANTEAQDLGLQLTSQQADYVAGRVPSILGSTITGLRDSAAQYENTLRHLAANVGIGTHEGANQEYAKDLSRTGGLTREQQTSDIYGQQYLGAQLGQFAGETIPRVAPYVAAAYAAPAAGVALAARGMPWLAEGLAAEAPWLHRGLAYSATETPTGAAESLAYNYGQYTDNYGDTDWRGLSSVAATDTAIAAAGGPIIEGIGAGFKAAGSRLLEMRKGAKNLDASTGQLNNVTGQQSNIVANSIKQKEALISAAEQEQANIARAAEQQHASNIEGIHGAEEAAHTGLDSYKSGRQSILDEVNKVSQGNPEIGGRVAQAVDTEIKPSELSKYGEYRALKEEVNQLENRLAGNKEPWATTKELKGQLDIKKQMLQDYEVAGRHEVPKKLGGLYDNAVKSIAEETKVAAEAAKRKPVLNTTVSERFPVLGKVLKGVEQFKKGVIKRKDIPVPEMPSRDFYISKRTEEIGQGATEGLTNKLGKEFDRLNQARNEAYNKLVKTQNPDKFEAHVNQIMDLERRLYQTSETKAAIGVDTRGAAEGTLKPVDVVNTPAGTQGVFKATDVAEHTPQTVSKPKISGLKVEGTPVVKTKVSSYEKVKQANPGLATKIENITNPEYKKFAEENVHKYNLNDAQVLKKVYKDFQGKQKLAKSSKAFKDAMRTDKKFRERIRSIKDESYKKFISENMHLYNPKDPYTASAMYEAYKPKKTIFNTPKAIESINKGAKVDAKIMEKAQKEIKDLDKKYRREAEVTQTKRCK